MSVSSEPVITFVADDKLAYTRCGQWLLDNGFVPEPGTSRWNHPDGRVGRICEAPRNAWRVETVTKGDSQMKNIDPEVLMVMRARAREGTRWAAYENKAMDSANAGHLQFLMVGNGCTYSDGPAKYPSDTVHGMGWRYLFVGYVNLETGEIEKED